MNKSLLEVCNITTGNLDSNAATKSGRYPFFTCAPEPLRINDYAFDDDVILLAGNNAQGNFHLTRYKGKFNAYQRTYILTARKGFDVDYIRYSLELYINHLKKVSQGSQTKFLTMGILEQFRINDIPYDLQKNQVSMLIAIDKKIELNKKINATLEAMAKTLYDYWFVQFDFPDENGKPYKTSGGKIVYNAELGREIPAGWEFDSIGNHVSIKHGISYSSDDLMGKGIPMINLNSFNVDSSYKMEGIKNYSGNYTNSKCIHPYDLAICLTQQTSIDIEGKTNVIGKAIFIPDCFQGDIVSSMDVGIILCDNYYGKYYLHSLINTNFFHRYITGFSIGTKIKHLHLEGLLQYKCEKPPDDILKKFNSILINKLKKQSCIIRENQTLAALRDWLLPMLMNGQVEFKRK